MKRGVASSIWGEGGRFHSGIEGRSLGEVALAARGKLSVIGGGGTYGGLRRTSGGSEGFGVIGLRSSRSSRSGTENSPVETLWKMMREEAMMKGTRMMYRRRRSLPSGSIVGLEGVACSS